MYNTIVTLKKGEGRTLKAGGMWVFDNEIASHTDPLYPEQPHRHYFHEYYSNSSLKL